jgi:riboflavin synthase
MFTGIVKGIGRVAALYRSVESARLAVVTAGIGTAGLSVGDSVAVSGVCLTVAALGGDRFECDLSGETLARSTLGSLGPGDRVNLEPAVAASQALGGHLVTGHVDGVALVRRVAERAGSLHATIEAPEILARYIAEKGSIALDGVSLTVGAVDGASFGIDIVPHTRTVTTLGSLSPGQSLNLEVDLIARYLERLLASRGAA